MNTEMTHAYDWHGRTLKDRNGDKIGKVDAVYLDEQTDKPEWALVNTGLFGTKSGSCRSPAPRRRARTWWCRSRRSR
jgi:uncharacterized protein YrrD